VLLNHSVEGLALFHRKEQISPLALCRRSDIEMHWPKHPDISEVLGILHGNQGKGVTTAAAAGKNENHLLGCIGELETLKGDEVNSLETTLEPSSNRLCVSRVKKLGRKHHRKSAIRLKEPTRVDDKGRPR
jgi:hypothetical protein